FERHPAVLAERRFDELVDRHKHLVAGIAELRYPHLQAFLSLEIVTDCLVALFAVRNGPDVNFHSLILFIASAQMESNLASLMPEILTMQIFAICSCIKVRVMPKSRKVPSFLLRMDRNFIIQREMTMTSAWSMVILCSTEMKLTRARTLFASFSALPLASASISLSSSKFMSPSCSRLSQPGSGG